MWVSDRVRDKAAGALLAVSGLAQVPEPATLACGDQQAVFASQDPISALGTGPLFGPGALYVLPDDGFRHEKRTGRLFDTAHRTHVGAVRPLAWFEVGPDDFPLTDRVITHDDDEPVWRTFWNARGRPRSRRP